MPGMLWLLLGVACVAAQDRHRSSSGGLGELLTGRAASRRSSRPLPQDSAAPPYPTTNRLSSSLHENQEGEGHIPSSSSTQEQLSVAHTTSRVSRTTHDSRYGGDREQSAEESDECRYICSNCRKVLSLRWAALCSGQCRSGGYAFNACSIAWNQLRYILLPN